MPMWLPALAAILSAGFACHSWLYHQDAKGTAFFAFCTMAAVTLGHLFGG